MKKLLCIALCIAMALSLSANGAQETDDNTIIWWHSNSGLRQKATDEMVRTFNETEGKAQDIQVKAIYQGSASDLLTKIKAIWQSGEYSQLPDIVQLDAQGVIDIRDQKSLIPTQTAAEACGYDLNQILDSARLSQTYKGQMIGMPFNCSTILLYYNKTLFDEKGLTPPQDLDQMREVTEKLIEKDENGNITRYGFAGVPTSYELSAWLGQQNGYSPLFDKNNGHNGVPEKALFEENGTLENFLSRWQDLYRTGGVENASGNPSGAFAAQKYAMVLSSSSSLTSMIKLTENNFTLGVAPLPRVDEKATGGVNIGGGALYLLDNGKKRSDKAFRFISYAVSPSSQLKWHKSTGYLPVNKASYESSEYKTFIEKNPLFKIPADQLKASNPALVGFWIPYSYEVYFTFQKGIRDMLESNKPVKESCEEMAGLINGYLNEYRQVQN